MYLRVRVRIAVSNKDFISVGLLYRYIDEDSRRGKTLNVEAQCLLISGELFIQECKYNSSLLSKCTCKCNNIVHLFL